jgi:hypothetical protein
MAHPDIKQNAAARTRHGRRQIPMNRFSSRFDIPGSLPGVTI